MRADKIIFPARKHVHKRDATRGAPGRKSPPAKAYRTGKRQTFLPGALDDALPN